LTSHLSTKIRACATISSLGIVYIHHFFLNDIPEAQQSTWDFWLQHIISEGIARFGLPFFWIMSGYLFYKNFDLTRATYKRKLQNRFISLFIPYVLWSAWGILLYYFVQTYILTDYAFTRGRIDDLNWGQLIHIWLWNPVTYQLWFLRDLFILVIASPFLYFLIKYGREAWILVLLVLYISGNELLWPFQRMLSLLGFSLGALLALREYRVTQRYYVIFPIVLMLWLTLIGLHLYWLHADITHQWILPLHKLARLLGVYVLWIGYDVLKVNKIFERYEWSKELIYFSFFLYLFHEPVLTFFKKGSLMVLPLQPPYTVAAYIAIPLIIFLSAFAIRKILKAWIPHFYSLITGNR